MMVVTQTVAAMIAAAITMFRMAAIAPTPATVTEKAPGGRNQNGGAKQD